MATLKHSDSSEHGTHYEVSDSSLIHKYLLYECNLINNTLTRTTKSNNNNNDFIKVSNISSSVIYRPHGWSHHPTRVHKSHSKEPWYKPYLKKSLRQKGKRMIRVQDIDSIKV